MMSLGEFFFSDFRKYLKWSLFSYSCGVFSSKAILGSLERSTNILPEYGFFLLFKDQPNDSRYLSGRLPLMKYTTNKFYLGFPDKLHS